MDLLRQRCVEIDGRQRWQFDVLIGDGLLTLLIIDDGLDFTDHFVIGFAIEAGGEQRQGAFTADFRQPLHRQQLLIGLPIAQMSLQQRYHGVWRGVEQGSGGFTHLLGGGKECATSSCRKASGGFYGW